MKHHLNKLKKLFIGKLRKEHPIAEPKEEPYQPPNFSMVPNVGKRDYTLSTWINKNHHWTRITQIQKDGILKTQWNDHVVPNSRVMLLGVFFEYDEVQKTIRQIQSEDKGLPFVTGTTFYLT